MKTQKILNVLYLSFVFIVLCTSFLFAANVGKGSYTDNLPVGEEQPPNKIYKTDNLIGAVPTNSWESSILWEQYSRPIYAHPLTFKAVESGLEIGTPRLGGGGVAYFGGHNVDITLKNSNLSQVDSARVDKITDWTVDVLMGTVGRNIKSTVVKGSPYVYNTFTGGNPVLELEGQPRIFHGDSHSQVLGITIGGINYGVFAPQGSTWDGIGTSQLTCNLPAGKNYLSIATLANSDHQTLNYFKDHAYAFVTDTKVSWDYNSNTSQLTTTFDISTSVKEGSNKKTIMGLYPHQWRNNNLIAPLEYSYKTIRGKMKTVAGQSFQTRYTYHGILPSFPNVADLSNTVSLIENTLNNYLNELATENFRGDGDTYWLGKDLGKMACALPLAEQVNNDTVSATLDNRLKTTLEDWFVASPGENKNLFYYDDNWGTLIGYPDSYNSADQLNDHHFHYAYFVHAAAQLALRDQTWADSSQWGGMVNKIIKDFANWERNDQQFPFLRSFDPYEGHSWASGHAQFADGNNQESSSEGINAAQSLILWGQATNNQEIRDLGIYLYTTESEAIHNYWFDSYGDIFNPAYSHQIASMVWGAKYSREIWWAGGDEEIHGINLLPMTAASTHLAKHPNAIKSNYDEMVAENGGAPDTWADIHYMAYALYDPTEALNKWSPSITSEAGESKAHTYHWLHSLNTIGKPDFTVTANTPLYGVFNKNGNKTYVAYNTKNRFKTVKFSDGTILDVGPNSMEVLEGNNSTPDPDPGPEPNPNPTRDDIPGKIEAEAYSSMSGIKEEDCVEGGKNIAWIDTGDWVKYQVDVKKAGTYQVKFRVASLNGSKDGIKLIQGSSALTTVSVPKTDSWQAWQTVSAEVKLKAGEQELEIYANNKLWNLNHLEFIKENDVPDTPIQEGQYYKIIAKHSGKCLDVSGISKDSGANVHQWSYVGGNNQQWKFESTGNGYYKIIAKHSDKVLNVQNSNVTNSANITQKTDNGRDNQQWKLEEVKNGYYKIIAKHSGKCLDVSGISKDNGANIHQWSYVGGNNQQWKILKVDSSNDNNSNYGVEKLSTNKVLFWVKDGEEKGRNKQWAIVYIGPDRSTNLHAKPGYNMDYNQDLDRWEYTKNNITTNQGEPWEYQFNLGSNVGNEHLYLHQ